MKIKTVRAARVEEALNQIVAELGPEAIVVSARRVLPAPAWQVWQQPLVELIAVVAEGGTSPHLSPGPAPLRGGEGFVPGGANARSLASGPRSPVQRARGAGLDVAEKPADYAALRRELIRSLAQAAARSTPRRDWAVHHLRHLLAQGLDEHLARRAVISAWAEAGLSTDSGNGLNAVNGFRERIERMKGGTEDGGHRRDAEGQNKGELLDERLAAHLQKLVRAQPPPPTAYVLRPLVLVGPPGAGKSTALARLALHLCGAGLRIGLMTITWGRKPLAPAISRVAHQLGLPLAAVASPEQCQRALMEMQAAEPAPAILVDTPGCAPDDGVGLRQLASFLAVLHDGGRAVNGFGERIERILKEGGPSSPAGRKRVAVQLVLNAAAPMDDLSAAALAFAPLGPEGLIWTHLDEAQRIGPVFNIAHATGLPLTYLASGPRGVSDFVPAQPALLVSRLLSRRKRQDG